MPNDNTLPTGDHPLLAAARTGSGTLSTAAPAALPPAPPRSKLVQLIALYDQADSVAFLAPCESIDSRLWLVPALSVSSHELERLYADAAAYLTARHAVGVTVFCYALTFDSDEFLRLSAERRLSLHDLLCADAQQVDLAQTACRLCIGARLSELTHAASGLSCAQQPCPDYLAVVDDSTVHYAETLPHALLDALRANGGFLSQPVRQLSDGQLTHDAVRRLDYAAELLRRGLFDVRQVALTCRIDLLFIHALLPLLRGQAQLQTARNQSAAAQARTLGFLPSEIEALCGAKPRAKTARYRRLDVSFGRHPDRFGVFIPTKGHNEVRVTAKPRLLLIGTAAYDALIVEATNELRHSGYEASLLSAGCTAASVQRHYHQVVTPEAVTAVVAAERPRALFACFGGLSALAAAAEHQLLTPAPFWPAVPRQCGLSITALSDGTRWLAFAPQAPTDWRDQLSPVLDQQLVDRIGLFTLRFVLRDSALTLLDLLPCADPSTLAALNTKKTPVAATAVQCLLHQPLHDSGWVE